MIEQTGRDIVTRTLLLAWINSQRSDSLKERTELSKTA